MGFFKKSLPSESKRTSLTIIAKGNKISGEMTVTGKLHIDGNVEGSITSIENISVGKTGEIKGRVEAKNITVSGLLEGNVLCEHLHISAGGRVLAKLQCAELTMDAKSQFIGERLPISEQSGNITQVLIQEAPAASVDVAALDYIDDLPDKITLPAADVVVEHSSVEGDLADKVPNIEPVPVEKVALAEDKSGRSGVDRRGKNRNGTNVSAGRRKVSQTKKAAIDLAAVAVKTSGEVKVASSNADHLRLRAKVLDENTMKMELKF